MRILTLLTSLLLVASSAFAQKLSSPAPVYDCGQVLFKTPVTAKFIIKNTTSRSVTLKSVETSCGCTTALASKHHVGSGKEITVSATYDAKQLGHFQKEIWIYEDGAKNPLSLTIKGVVVTEIKDFSSSYPSLIGQIRADKSEIEFDNVNKGTTQQHVIQILNTTGETIEPVVMHLPDYLKATISPTRLAPEQGGEITITLYSDKLPRMGLTQTNVYLGKYPGDKVAPEKEIGISAILLPSFPEDAASSAIAPRLQMSKTTLDRSQMQGKQDALKDEIVIQNIGKSPLDFSSLQMSTAGMQISLGKMHLAPSESTKLKVTINNNDLKQIKKKPRILMITNDPQNPKVIIDIK